MQPQWAAYVAQTCQGDPPYAGMAQLYVEVAPATRSACSSTPRSRTQTSAAACRWSSASSGRSSCTSRDPASIGVAAEVILERLHLARADATRPELIAEETITRVEANQAQLVNRLRSASLLLEGETMFLLELQPAAYVAAAANEAEKRAGAKLVYAAMLGASGRLIVSGRDDEVAEARAAALAAVHAT